MTQRGVRPKAPVSVVIPCYRCADTIARALASVAAQTLVPEEVILVEDGSPDSTLERLRQLEESHERGWIRIVALPRLTMLFLYPRARPSKRAGNSS